MKYIVPFFTVGIRTIFTITIIYRADDAFTIPCRVDDNLSYLTVPATVLS